MDTTVQDQEPEDVQRWTTKRTAALVLSILKGETSIQEAARKHGVTVAEIEDRKERFLLGAENALRARPKDEEALKEERGILVHAKKLMEFADSSEKALYSNEGSVIEKIQRVISLGAEAVTIDPSVSHLLKNLELTLIQLEDVTLALRDYSRRVEINPGRLEEIENRPGRCPCFAIGD